MQSCEARSGTGLRAAGRQDNHQHQQSSCPPFSCVSLQCKGRLLNNQQEYKAHRCQQVAYTMRLACVSTCTHLNAQHTCTHKHTLNKHSTHTLNTHIQKHTCIRLNGGIWAGLSNHSRGAGYKEDDSFCSFHSGHQCRPRKPLPLSLCSDDSSRLGVGSPAVFTGRSHPPTPQL